MLGLQLLKTSKYKNGRLLYPKYNIDLCKNYLSAWIGILKKI